MRALVAACAAFLVVVSTMPAMAGTEEAPVIAFHLTDLVTKGICTDNSPGNTTCDTYIVDAPLNESRLLYLVVARAAYDTTSTVASIAGLDCGIEYNGESGVGIDVFQWTLCADLEFVNAGPRGEWPEAGGGTRLTWDPGVNCQEEPLASQGIHAVAGAFYVFAYDEDQFKVTPNRNIPFPGLTVANCQSAATGLDTTAAAGCAGIVGFGGAASHNPCDFTGRCVLSDPVEPSTWGQIKSQYSRN